MAALLISSALSLITSYLEEVRAPRESYRNARMENPFPKATAIASVIAEWRDRTNRTTRVAAERFGELRKLFDDTQRDPAPPAPISTLLKLQVTMKNGELVDFEIYSNGSHTGAFRRNELWFRGGADHAFNLFRRSLSGTEPRPLP